MISLFRLCEILCALCDSVVASLRLLKLLCILATVFVCACILPRTSTADDAPRTGPETEKRFPPLVLPAGFKATLFACDPLVEYLSVIALGPRQGTVFVAHDYVTGLGIEIVRRDEIRLVEDTDGDGYADKSTLYADGFNSIQGLAYHAGTVYAMHAPLLTSLKDTNGDGRADERKDLLSGLGLLPEKNSSRLHCANGVAVGHDGWLYLAMGDNGTDVQRPEGDRLIFNAGGILRCRPDGRDLHVFAGGLRNIYDIALDEELNVFVRDNENDGGDYMIRVCHSFHGADHGYPYLYYERPHEAQRPLAELGRGSSAGIACYLETAFPPEYRGNLFCCEWGRAVVRYERHRSGSSFATMKEFDVAAAAATDPYGLKPTDVIVDRDGSLLVSDWGDGQRPKRGRGRLYRITYTGPTAGSRSAPSAIGVPSEFARLNSPGHFARVEAQAAIAAKGFAGVTAMQRELAKNSIGPLGRLHAVWIHAQVGGREAIGELFSFAESDPDPRVRAQAVRAIADLTDPSLGGSKSPRGDTAVATRLGKLAIDQDPRIVLEVVVALGRLRYSDSPAWLRDHLKNPDSTLMHAAQQTLRRADNWPAVLAVLDLSDDHPVRGIALNAIADQANEAIVDGLIDRLKNDPLPSRRKEYADALTRVYKQPGPWTYWGYRPGPRPANTTLWDRTDAIAEVLDRTLADPDRDVRAATLRRMQREDVPIRLATLAAWLKDEREASRVKSILDSLAKSPADNARELLAGIVLQPDHAVDNRRAALVKFVDGLSSANEAHILELSRHVEDGPVVVDLISELSKRPAVGSRSLLLAKLDSRESEVRAAAIGAAARLAVGDAASHVGRLLEDPDVLVRRAAAAAAGALSVKDSTPRLLALARDEDAATRSASLDSLRLLREPGAVAAALAALDHPATQVAAIDYLGEFGSPEQTNAVSAVAASVRSIDVLTAIVRALSQWESREPPDSPRRQELAKAISEVQGRSGSVLLWHSLGPLAPAAAAELVGKHSPPNSSPQGSRPLIATGPDSRVEIPAAGGESTGSVWLASADVWIADPTKAQFLASSNSTLQVWLNGRSIHRREKAAAFQPDSDRFEADFSAGLNRLFVQCDVGPSTQFHVRFRPLSSSAEHERLVQFALQNAGNADKGRELFANAEKSLCIKCHRRGDQGEKVGPDLTGVGSRISRIHLIESILEPSRTIAPSYETLAVALVSGRVVTGVKVSEDATTLVIGDDTGKRHEIPKTDIDERVAQRRSTMPEGLEKRLSDREFLDLVTFLLAR